MNYDNFADRVQAVRQLVARLASSLSAHDITSMTEDLDAGEPKVAFEHLCVQIDEFEIPITADLYNHLVKVGNALRADSSYWEDVRSYVSY